MQEDRKEGKSIQYSSLQNGRYETVIENWIEQWRQKRQQKILFRFLKEQASTAARQQRQLAYCDKFYKSGLYRRGLKGFKLYAQIAGLKSYERRLKEKITIEVDAKVIEKKN